MKSVTSWVVLLVLCATVEVLYADDWPEWRGAGRRGILTETGLVDSFPADGLAVAWRTPIHSGYSGPAVAGGRVFVTDATRPDLAKTAVVERVRCSRQLSC